MIYRVIIQPPAYADIEDAYLFIREHSVRAATKWLAGLEEAIQSLDALPNRCAIARESREFDEEIRQLLYGRRKHKYRVLFVVRGDEVRVLHVRHGARRAMSRGEIRP